jgi:hypothetical protein
MIGPEDKEIPWTAHARPFPAQPPQTLTATLSCLSVSWHSCRPPTTHPKVVLPEVPLSLLDDGDVNLRRVYCRTRESARSHVLKLELGRFHIEQQTLTPAKEISGIGKMSRKHEKG